MPHRRFRFLFFALAAALSVSGCGRQQADPAGVALSAATTDSGKGSGFVWSISYPALPPQWQALDHAIHDFAAAQKKAFLAASAMPDPARSVDNTLDLTFAVARHTADFVSVLAGGSQFTGGVHGMPYTASFNLDTRENRLVNLTDLFADADAALRALSAECRRQLEGRYEEKMRDDPGAMTADADKSMRAWIEKGTAPMPANFKVFLIDGLDTKAIGLTMIFPPYQVAAYADGPQQVEVPAKVFYDLLKPDYQSAFAIDTEAAKLAPGVR